MGRHDQVRQLQTPSLSTRDHRPRGLALFQVPIKPEMLLERGFLVSYETVRFEVCAGLRSAPQAEHPKSPRHLQWCIASVGADFV